MGFDQSEKPVRRAHLWRDLDEITSSDEFHRWADQEFPDGWAARPPGMSRRQMLRLMAASFALAGAAGCRKTPARRIVSPAHIEGAARSDRPAYYATAVTDDGFAKGILVKTQGGRPTKVEGNPDHPASLGATDVFAQAAILTLYDPDRSQVVMRGHDISMWQSTQNSISQQVGNSKKNGGRGLRILTGPTTSPSLIARMHEILRSFREAKWCVWSPLDSPDSRKGIEWAVGRPGHLLPRLSHADVIVSFDCDFLDSGPACVRHARDFSDGRKVSDGSVNRFIKLFVAEPCPTLTGAQADDRLPIRRSQISALMQALLRQIKIPGFTTGYSNDQLPDQQLRWCQAAARALTSHPGRGLILAGPGSGASVHAAALAASLHLGSALEVSEPFAATSDEYPLPALTEEMARGDVQTLLMIDVNPVYDAPVDIKFEQALARVDFSVHMGLYQDETAHRCSWHLPMLHGFESWGDARAFDGTASIVQPVIEPLYEGSDPLQLLAMFGDQARESTQDIVKKHWKAQWDAGRFEEQWRQSLQAGMIAGSAARKLDAKWRDGINDHLSSLASPPDAATLELNFSPDPRIADGRFANNCWLQELPKPITLLTWDNAALLSQSTAARLKLINEDVIELVSRGRRLKAPVWITPGHADDSVTLHLGYGRTEAGSIGSGLGFSAYALRDSRAISWDAGAQLSRTNERYRLACTQNHHSMEGRDLARTAKLRLGSLLPDKSPTSDIPLSLYPEHPQHGQQWGMVIDLTSCIGCGACTIACQAENNIPVVGKTQVLNHREMHWIRIDRYFEGPPDNPSIIHQPVPCMHCENAPCELVCPVGATTHSTDGLNEMTYNRCVGTRYCSNNCPYKVRRFNFLQYADETSPTLALQRNNQVTVREQGVMEKCTYCIQRIRTAQIDARKQNRDVQDGEVMTACQQVCPTRAIVFGDISDRSSAVSALKRSPNHYALLPEQNTRPRTTYLAKICPDQEVSSA